MREFRPNCERCDAALPPESGETFVCSFGCTFCRSCVEAVYRGRCPNCGGSFVPRPIRRPDATALRSLVAGAGAVEER